MALTSEELSLLRKEGHRAKLYLSVHKPGTLMQARLNDADVERGDRSIVYDTGSGTGFANILAGMVLWVSDTAAGSKSKGTVRIKSVVGTVSSGTFTVAENSIDWADDDYLTVKDDFPLFPVFARLADDGTFYKDYDVAYTDQNEEPDPVAISGPHRAGFMSSGSCVFSFDQGDESYAIAPGATISTHSWSFRGTGNFDNAASATPTLTVTVANPNGDWLYHTITDDNGKSHTTRRLVFTHERETDVPYTDCEINSFNGGFEQGGWSTSIRVFGDADTNEFPDNALVIVWWETWFGTTETFIGGPDGAEDVLFCGYIRGETVQKDWNTGEVTFTATTINGLMQRHIAHSISLEAVRSTPSTWYEYDYRMNVARVLHHLWRWHSTLLDICDVFLETSSTRYMKACDDLVRNNLYSIADSFARQYANQTHVCCNKQGQLCAERDVQMMNATDRSALTLVMDITDADRDKALVMKREPEKKTGLIHVDGFVFDGSDNTPIIARAPGTAPEDTGAGVMSVQRQALLSQTDGNELAGRKLAQANNTFKDIRISFGNYAGALDFVPQEKFTMSLAAADTTRGIVWASQVLYLRSAQISYDPQSGGVTVEGTFEKDAEGPDGVTGDYPTDIPGTAEDPDLPDWPPIPETAAGTLVAFTYGAGVRWSRDKGASWVARNGSDTGSLLNLLWGYVDPWSVKYGGGNPEKAHLWKGGLGFIRRSTDAGRTWEDVTPLTDPPNSWNDVTAPTAATVYYNQGVPDFCNEKVHYWIAYYMEVGGAYRGYLLKTSDNGRSWNWYNMGSDHLTATAWNYPVRATEVDFLWCDNEDSGSPARTLVNPDNVSADDGAAGGARIAYTGKSATGSFASRIIQFHFDGWFSLDPAVLDGGINIEAQLQTSVDTMTIADSTYIHLTVAVGEFSNCYGYGSDYLDWDGNVEGYPPSVPDTKNKAMDLMTPRRSIWITIVEDSPGAAGYTGSGYHQHLFDYIKIYPGAIYTQVWPTAIDIDKKTGRFLYVSTWEGKRTQLRIYDTEDSLVDPAFIRTVAAHDVLKTDMESRAYWVAARALNDAAHADYEAHILVYGLWPRTATLRDQLIAIEAVKARTDFVDFLAYLDDASWLTSEWLGGSAWLEHDHIVVVLMRTGGANCEVWETTDFASNWNLRSEIPFISGASKGVEFGMSVHRGTAKIMAAGDRTGDKIFSQDADYDSAWTDISPGGSPTKIVALQWVYGHTW